MMYGFLLAMVVQFSISRAQTLTYCQGHYGEGGDDSEMSDSDLEWCCVSCNCKDLGDKLPDDECPNVELATEGIACPGGTKQIGSLGADIGGCGLEGCDARYQDSYPTIRSCKLACEARTDCRSFTWAPMDGDRNHGGKTVCTLYAGFESNQQWLGVSGDAEQIMCRVLQCPFGSTQIGEQNADISGCGLEGCAARYQHNYPSPKSCLAGCLSNDDCVSFTWAPLGGDPNHVDKKVCTLYNSLVPNQEWGKQIMCQPLECPVGSSQVGDLNADIGGCGLEGCNPRYLYEDAEACLAGCQARSDCVAFNWAPLSGDQNHPNKEVCTLYNSATPTSTWGYEQIFCKVDDGARSGLFVLDVVDENGNVSSGMVYMLYLVIVLLVVNLVCLTWSNCKKNDKRTKYGVVSMESETEVEID